EPLWDWVIRARRASNMLPALEAILAGFGQQAPHHNERESISPDEDVILRRTRERPISAERL
ncbi:MAG: hypothetical protein KDF65_15475, partial [Anaerolineae bacterium]|nr:hypothetical protein [Anaerolineae bacterium]